MAYIPGEWTTPINIVGTMKINETDEALEAIVNTDPGSIRVFLNSEFVKIEAEMSTNYAAIAGLATQVFSVAPATVDAHAVSRVFGDGRYQQSAIEEW